MKPSYERPRHLGLVGERCPVCGEPIETLLSAQGRNPKRCCWKCDGGEYLLSMNGWTSAPTPHDDDSPLTPRAGGPLRPREHAGPPAMAVVSWSAVVALSFSPPPPPTHLGESRVGRPLPTTAETSLSGHFRINDGSGLLGLPSAWPAVDLAVRYLAARHLAVFGRGGSWSPSRVLGVWNIHIRTRPDKAPPVVRQKIFGYPSGKIFGARVLGMFATPKNNPPAPKNIFCRGVFRIFSQSTTVV